MSEQPPSQIPPQQYPPAPLAYSQAQGSGRPGILTAVGIVSIVMSLLSLLFAVGAALQAVFLQLVPSFVKTVAVATTMPTTGPAAGPTTNPFSNMQFDFASILLSLIDAGGRLVLSIVLFIAAIMVLKDARSGRKLHLVWAYLRIPLAIFGAFAYYRLMEQTMASMANMPGGPPAGSRTSMDFSELIGIGYDLARSLAYPVAVIIVMNNKRVKDFYATLGT